MYPSRGSNRYGQQQPYTPQSTYTPQNLSAAALLGGSHQESELARYRAHAQVHGHPSVGAAGGGGAMSTGQHYTGQYGSVYGSGTQQGSATSNLEGRSNYGSSMPDSPKYAANEYVPSSSRSYGQKVDQLYSDRISEYPSVDRLQYADRHSAYLGRNLPSETADRYAESVAFGHNSQSKLYERLEQATLQRQEEMLKARTLQSASVDGGARQTDYLAARTAVHLPTQDPIAYGARVDLEPRNLSMLSSSSYSGQHTSSILGAAPRRSVDDLVYAQSSTNPGYGVSLPPGRDYGSGKALHGASNDLDFGTSMMGHVDHPRLDDRKDGRAPYARELARKEQDRDYLREREREREREKDRLREREREREREKDRERQRERERERREKERERDHKRALELKQRTPPRVSRDRRGSSLAKDIRSQKRDSPRLEVLHRRHSPVKEKRREYDCKVFSFSFVEAERDYLSLDKRYPRLYVSPECSKVAVHWPKKNLHLSLYTPVSFEHDFVEEAAAEKKETPSTEDTSDTSKSGAQNTIWNAKIILMSGLSENALAELSSERHYDDRIPHFCNMLRFAVLKQNNSLRAIGGPWETVDGGNPSDDDSLIQTALRYAKDVTSLDLNNCSHWNRFLEIHYERIGKDGLFNHKEVTVLYVPDLSECLPLLDMWREQWLNHRKAVTEREHLNSLKKEVLPGDKEEASKDQKKLKLKDSVLKTELPKKKEPSSADPGDTTKEDIASKLETKENLASEHVMDTDNAVENKEVVGSPDEEKSAEIKVQQGNSSAQAAVGAKTGKKKIIKRIVKRKVAKKKDGAETSDALDKKDAGETNVATETDAQEDGLSGNTPAIKTFVRKKIVKKLVNSTSGKDESLNTAVDTPKETQTGEDSTNMKSEESSAVVQEGSTKSMVKKKVVKRVPKRKTISADINSAAGEDGKKGDMVNHPENNKGERKEDSAENTVNKVTTDTSITDPGEKEDKNIDNKDLPGSALETDNQKVSQNDNSTKSNEREQLKDDKQKKDPTKIESRSTKKRSDELHRHPGFILQTKGSKGSKLQSLSLSLDSLLDYSDKDIEESSFELSIFAESMYEMLQFEMGSRLLAFLQKLRATFVAKRSQQKRQEKDDSQKEVVESPSRKRVKTDKVAEGTKKLKTETTDDNHEHDGSTTKEKITTTEQVDEPKKEDEIPEEEPEEDPEEDEEMADQSLNEESKEELSDAEKKAADLVGKDVTQVEQNDQPETARQNSETNSNLDLSNKDKLTKVGSKTKGTHVCVDKELLQAFRFFDRNRVGYLRVEDLRLIIHNLGMFLSHRDVKELVQSALLESNTGRDDKILYDKLVKISTSDN